MGALKTDPAYMNFELSRVADRLNKIYQKVIKSRMREIVKFRPDLSTRAESN